MPNYRAYLVDADGQFRAVVELDCPDDDAAVEKAKLLVEGYDIELWERTRIVARLARPKTPTTYTGPNAVRSHRDHALHQRVIKVELCNSVLN